MCGGTRGCGVGARGYPLFILTAAAIPPSYQAAKDEREITISQIYPIPTFYPVKTDETDSQAGR